MLPCQFVYLYEMIHNFLGLAILLWHGNKHSTVAISPFHFSEIEVDLGFDLLPYNNWHGQIVIVVTMPNYSRSGPYSYQNDWKPEWSKLAYLYGVKTISTFVSTVADCGHGALRRKQGSGKFPPPLLSRIRGFSSSLAMTALPVCSKSHLWNVELGSICRFFAGL